MLLLVEYVPGYDKSCSCCIVPDRYDPIVVVNDRNELVKWVIEHYEHYTVTFDRDKIYADFTKFGGTIRLELHIIEIELGSKIAY